MKMIDYTMEIKLSATKAIDGILLTELIKDAFLLYNAKTNKRIEHGTIGIYGGLFEERTLPPYTPPKDGE